MTEITLLTRQSKLALWQAKAVKEALEQHDPSLTVRISGQSTLGDRDKTTPLKELGNKTSFVSELQNLLVSTPNAIAVHSLKDLSVQSHPDLALEAYLPRADPRDVIISHHAQADLASLPLEARIGTGSPRRRAQLASIRPDFKLCDIRGNITTRIEACLQGDYDAIILAAAGLHRLELNEKISEYLSTNRMLPAIGQGIIAAECRQKDTAIRELLKQISDPNTEACAIAERAVNVVLGGDCHTPIAAYAECNENRITLKAMVSSEDGEEQLIREVSGPPEEAQALGETIAQQLLDAGAAALLNNTSSSDGDSR